MNDQPIEAEIVTESKPAASNALVVRPGGTVAPSNLFGTVEPVEVIAKAGAVASALKAVVAKQGLISKISNKEYPRCEAWTLLGTMLGVFPVLCWTRKIENGWEARVEARTKDGATIGAAEAECLKSEKNWSNRDDFALRSMAQTRATAKALRMPLGFVMTLAGYEPTPAEEMVSDHPQKAQEAPQAPRGCPDAPQAAKTPHIASGAQERAPTEKNRTRMLEILTGPQGQFDTSTVQAFFHALHDPAPLMPNEGVLELNPRFCPKSQQEMESLKLSLGMFKAGEPAVWPYKPWVESVPEPTPAPKEESKDPQEKDLEWWRKIIVPIPRKGQKKADYERHPDTLGSLWELRHGNDEEAEIARRRLWGFCQHDKAEGWTDKKGQYHPPSNAEVRFFEAVQVFKAWLSANHPDETL